jgi:hypothetical protein
MVDRCLFALVALDRVTGEKEAIVGGLGSLGIIGPPSSSSRRDELGVADIIHGVSYSQSQSLGVVLPCIAGQGSSARSHESSHPNVIADQANN